MTRATNDGILSTGEREVFRDALREQMKKNKIIAAELARRAEISRDAVSSYMNLRSLPSEETLARIAKALRCKPDDLKVPSDSDPLMVCEQRESHLPGHQLLVVRMPVPYAALPDIMAILLPIKEKLENKKK